MGIATTVLVLVAIAGGVALALDRGRSAHRPVLVRVRAGKQRR